MSLVLRCALGAAAVAGAILVTACQSSPASAPSPSHTSTPAPVTTTVAPMVPTTTSAAPAPTPTTVTVVNDPGFSAAPIGVLEGGGGRLIAPNEFVLSGDSTLWVEKANWTAWTTTEATGSGVMVTVDCVPDCATGHQTRYAVTIHFTKPVTTSCGQVWGSEAYTFTGSGQVPNLSPPFAHRNGPREWDVTPDLADIRC